MLGGRSWRRGRREVADGVQSMQQVFIRQQALRPDQQEAILRTISELTGKKVKPAYSVDPELLGGVIVNIGSKVYDGSVRGQLAALGRRLGAN